MKNSTFAAILAFLACAVGVLTACAIYLYKREKELNEYEKLLFDADEAEEAEDEPEEEAEEEFVMPVEEPAKDEPSDEAEEADEE